MLIENIKIPGSLLQDRKLQALDRTIYGVIDWFEKKDRRCVAGNPIIAKILNCSKRSVTNSITRLEKGKYIKRDFDGKSNSGNRILKIIPLAVSKQQEAQCFYCGLKDPSGAILTEDHFIPISKGGSNDPSNRVLCCRPCNSRKNDLTGIEYLEQLF